MKWNGDKKFLERKRGQHLTRSMAAPSSRPGRDLSAHQMAYPNFDTASGELTTQRGASARSLA